MLKASISLCYIHTLQLGTINVIWFKGYRWSWTKNLNNWIMNYRRNCSVCLRITMKICDITSRCSGWHPCIIIQDVPSMILSNGIDYLASAFFCFSSGSPLKRSEFKLKIGHDLFLPLPCTQFITLLSFLNNHYIWHRVVRTNKWHSTANANHSKNKVKLSLCLTKYHTMKTKHHAMKKYGGVEVYLQAFLSSALDGGEWSTSCLSHFTPVETAPGTQMDRRLRGPHNLSGLGGEEKNPHPCQESNPSRPLRNLVTILTGLSRLLSEYECPTKCLRHFKSMIRL
jgi:hypothetical protein